MSRNSLIVLGVLTLAVTALRAQTPVPRDPAQATAPPTGTGTIAGIVKDIDGTAVRRCTVEITGDMRLERMTVAGDNGRFSFTSLPPGRFTITAKKAGYPEMSYGAKRPFRAGAGVFLQDGQQVRDLALTLARGAVITGIVYDERGQPMPGVPVMAWEVRTSLGGERTLDYPASGPETVVTDDRGMYRVYGLAPGDYTLGTTWYFSAVGGSDVRVLTDAEIRAAFQTANTPPATPGLPAPAPPDPPRYSYSAVFAPGVTDPLGAATFSLSAGDERTGVDLRMQFVPMAGIEGVVVAPDGAPFSARLSITRRSPVQALNTSSVRSAQNGVPFSSGSLSPGRYTVMAEVPVRSDGPALWAMSDVVVGGDKPVSVSMTLQPGLTATGRVVFAGGATQPPGDVTKASISIFPTGPIRSQAVSAIDSSGVLTVTGLIPGTYAVRGSVPGGAAGTTWRVQSVVIDGTDVTDRAFDIGNGGVTGLVVTFSDQVSELSGSLTLPSGAPATDYFVIAIPADKTYWLPQSRRIVSTRPDRAGRYSFRGLPPGAYRIALTTDLVPRDLEQVSALEQLALQSVAVTLAIGEKRTLDLQTPGGGGSVPPRITR